MIALIISVGNKSFAQLSETMFSFNYGLAPIGHDDIDFYKTDFKVGIPTKLKTGVLIQNVGFTSYGFDYMKDFSFLSDAITQIYDINYAASYILPLSATWELTTGAKAAIVSNLTNKVNSNDLQFTGSLLATKTLGNEGNAETISLGVSYATITGKPTIIPLFSYTKEVNDKFSFGIGFPETSATYKLSEISSVKTELLMDGFYANLNKSISMDTTVDAHKASFSTTSLGVTYSYLMDNFWAINFKGGYALSNDYKLLSNDDITLYNFNTTSKPFFAAGITFNIKNQTKN